MRVLLDTSVLLGPPPPLDGAEVAISVVSLAELHFGVLVARDADVRGERLRRVGLIEKTFDALPVDDAVAREYGRLAAATVQAGRRPRGRFADLVIAATARAHGAALWTRNADDVRGLDDLLEVRALG